mmetsp:Transcript_97789/g.183858  ORF Transcript_97789/g.183858 Transcript_97789/m.183858 type:complete len:293 (-) Transcript_97789:15-893(-)
MAAVGNCFLAMFMHFLAAAISWWSTPSIFAGPMAVSGMRDGCMECTPAPPTLLSKISRSSLGSELHDSSGQRTCAAATVSPLSVQKTGHFVNSGSHSTHSNFCFASASSRFIFSKLEFTFWLPLPPAFAFALAFCSILVTAVSCLVANVVLESLTSHHFPSAASSFTAAAVGFSWFLMAAARNVLRLFRVVTSSCCTLCQMGCQTASCRLFAASGGVPSQLCRNFGGRFVENAGGSHIASVDLTKATSLSFTTGISASVDRADSNGSHEMSWPKILEPSDPFDWLSIDGSTA